MLINDPIMSKPQSRSEPSAIYHHNSSSQPLFGNCSTVRVYGHRIGIVLGMSFDTMDFRKDQASRARP